MSQIASIMTIRETLGGKSTNLLNKISGVPRLTLIQDPGSPLPCTLQDPAYSKLDRQYLQSLGFGIADDSTLR